MTTTLEVSGFVVSDIAGLDPITVLFRDIKPGAGYLIVTCYNEAWTTYWGAMAARTVKQFVASVDVDYLTRNLLWSRKATKAQEKYVQRIAAVVIEACRNTEPRP